MNFAPRDASFVLEIFYALYISIFIDEVLDEQLEFSAPFDFAQEADVGFNGLLIVVRDFGDHSRASYRTTDEHLEDARLKM